MNSIASSSDISIGYSALVYGNQDQTSVLRGFTATGLRVLSACLNSSPPTAREQLAQRLINMQLTDGYALITPGSGQSFGNRGSDGTGMPLLGIISSAAYSSPSPALTNYELRVQNECPNGGVTNFDGDDYGHWFNNKGPVAYDAITGVFGVTLVRCLSCCV